MQEKFCPQCGAPIEEGAVQCRYCRAPLEQENRVQLSQEYSQKERTDSSNDKIYGILAYLGLLVLVPIFAAPKSAYVRFHANQGLVLIIAELIITFSARILGSLWGFSLIFLLARLVCFAFAVIGLVAAARGEQKELPFIGQIHLLK